LQLLQPQQLRLSRRPRAHVQLLVQLHLVYAFLRLPPLKGVSWPRPDWYLLLSLRCSRQRLLLRRNAVALQSRS
jgi:hypothetical protein